jgi:hypothetical protein
MQGQQESVVQQGIFVLQARANLRGSRFGFDVGWLTVTVTMSDDE